jgi:serine/threonine protein kinase/tetratricopeptide (TPR) repeat protein
VTGATTHQGIVVATVYPAPLVWRTIVASQPIDGNVETHTPPCPAARGTLREGAQRATRVTADSSNAGSLPAISAALHDRYRFEREIGAGGMATVYLASDLKHDRPVAVKVLRGGETAVDVERFHREIRVLARLRHPFILPLHDSGEAAGALFFVMPYVDGESLRARIVRDGPLPVTEALEIGRQILDALQTAHDEGVIHRDVKPENILIARSGHALLADFGIARGIAGVTRAETMTQVGMAIGTVAYMSPEQAMGEREVDARSDVYAMACVLFEMLAGTPPFTGSSAMSVLSKHLSAPPPDAHVLRADVPPAVGQILMRAMAKDPRDRPASARELAQSLTTSAERRAARHTPTSLAGVGTVAARLSIAVLPITNIGGSADDEYFSEGLTEELTSALSRLEGLRVVSRTSSASFRGQALPLTTIASQLGVEFVVEGSVRRAGQRIRLTAKLIRASEDAPLWSETFDRTLDDVFALQDEITARVVDTIAQALQLGKLRGQVPVATTRNLEAYDLYLLGRHHWYARSEDGMRRARDLFQQAIDLDAGYAPAWSGLADASAILASWQFADPAEMFPVAASAARRALELDDSLAEAHASLGFVKMNWEWDWDGVLRELHRAIELNPNHETAHRWLSAFLAGTGQVDAAMPIARRALLLDPLSVLPHMNLGIIHMLSGNHADAEAEFRRVLAMQPGFLRGHSFLGATLALQGFHEEAASLLEALVEGDKPTPIYVWTLGMVYAMAGRLEEARVLLDPFNRSGFPQLYRAIGHKVLGETDAVFQALEQGLEERSDWMYSLGTQPWLMDLHSDPRFQIVLAKLALPAAPTTND